MSPGAARLVLLLVSVCAPTFSGFRLEPAAPPPDLAQGVAANEILWSPNDAALDAQHMPAVGNGFLGLQIGSSWMYLAGLYNGRASASPSHRAALRSPHAARQSFGRQFHSYLHLRGAFFGRRSFIDPVVDDGVLICGDDGSTAACTRAASRTWVEERTYAHRTIRSALVYEVSALGAEGDTVRDGASSSFSWATGPAAYMSPRAAPGSWNREHFVALPFDSGLWSWGGAAWRLREGAADSPDLVLRDVTAVVAADADGAYREVHDGEVRVLWARTREAEADGVPLTDVIVVTHVPPSERIFIAHAGDVFALVTIVRLSLECPEGAEPPALFSRLADLDASADVRTLSWLIDEAMRDYRLAVEMMATNTLLMCHYIAWSGASPPSEVPSSHFGFRAHPWHANYCGLRQSPARARLPPPLWDSGVRVSAAERAAVAGRLLDQIVASSQYSLLSFSREDWPFGSSPGGLSGSGYGGRQFWDLDTFSLPVFQLFHPALAHAAIAYRLHRLPGARSKARSYSPPFAGAMMPWESGLTGVEACPEAYPTGTKEIHISGDVALSIAQLWRLEGMEASEWLRDTAFPLLAEIADFWVSRATSKGPGEGGGGEAEDPVAGFNDAQTASVVCHEIEESEYGEDEAALERRRNARRHGLAILHGILGGNDDGDGVGDGDAAAVATRVVIEGKLLDGDEVDEHHRLACSRASYLCRYAAAEMFDDNRDHYDDATLIAAGGTPLHIRGVIPPTEYYSHVDDSVYTNAVAMASLQYASSVASALGLPPFVSLPWRVALARLHFPEPVAFEGGSSGVDAAAAAATGSPDDRREQTSALCDGRVRPYFEGFKAGERVQLLDACMLAWPLDMIGEPFVENSRLGGYSFPNLLNDLDYYIRHQEPGGSVAFSWALNSLLYALAGDVEQAEALLDRSHDGFVFGPFAVWMEGHGGWGCSNFVTGAGAIVEAVAYGFAGAHTDGHVMSFRPQLPKKLATVELRGVRFRGTIFSVAYNLTHFTVDRVAMAMASSRSSHLASGMWTRALHDDDLLSGAATDVRRPSASIAAAFASRPWLHMETEEEGEATLSEWCGLTISVGTVVKIVGDGVEAPSSVTVRIPSRVPVSRKAAGCGPRAPKEWEGVSPSSSTGIVIGIRQCPPPPHHEEHDL